MMKSNNEILSAAIFFAKEGFPVFALSPYSKIPRKGSRGFKDATTDLSKVIGMFESDPESNLGISLIDTPYFVIDADRHTAEKDGVQTLLNLSKGNPLPDGTTTIRTPNNGLHLLFESPKDIKIKQRVGFKPGLDVITNFIVAAPSKIKRKDGSVGTYEVIGGSFKSIKTAPKWLISAITGNQETEQAAHSHAPYFSSKEDGKKFTASFIEKIMNGATEGNRNNFFASVIGTLLKQNMDPKMAYEFAIHINDNFIIPSLSESELNSVFSSILKREIKQKRVVN